MRFYIVALLIALCMLESGTAAKCPNGGQIMKKGLSNTDKQTVTAAHNNYRTQIRNGLVPGQPKGINLETMIYDNVLGDKAKVVSNTCKMEHIIAKDSRWGWVGQNLYISWSSEDDNGIPKWNDVVEAWFAEHTNFIYPNKSNGVTGHYTQVVWADSTNLGCHFIYFIDSGNPQYKYAKLYTCNYGPGGNIQGQAPYNTQ